MVRQDKSVLRMGIGNYGKRQAPVLHTPFSITTNSIGRGGEPLLSKTEKRLSEVTGSHGLVKVNRQTTKEEGAMSETSDGAEAASTCTPINLLELSTLDVEA
ncbi:hypothetical protein J3459_010962 [Metarhizium acridum]|nr:hypothetical protein J3459_010962 [Metarhizium acridum]